MGNNFEFNSLNIKKNNYEELLFWCTKCRGWKAKEEFYKINYMCKVCRNKKIAEKRKTEKEKNLAEFLLRESCKLAIQRSRSKKKKGYENVKCEWASWRDMYEDLKNKKLFKDDWKHQTEIYKEWGEDQVDRPTIDRIDPQGDYSLENIQCLSYQENVLKDKNTVTNVFYYDEEGRLTYQPYKTVKQAVSDLGVNYERFRRNRDAKVPVFLEGKPLFIQSSNP
ncbi:hypothetical protein MKY89_27905 [Bacillus sp. FSL W7-1294]|uniref:hypothetical protein n=1 Tax=Bacillus TaxID=1386 RepID=UPI00077B1C96|nr:hypothetical protein [Bacillus cereus]KXY70697.1 hypothetical protein AT270_27255 [Bacillus cereus]